MKTKKGQQYLKTMLLALMEIYSLNIYTILCTYLRHKQLYNVSRKCDKKPSRIQTDMESV